MHTASDAMFCRPAWLCLRFASCVATQQNTTFLGAVHPTGAATLKFELGRDFYTVHLPAKFHHPMFTRSEVIVLTKTHTNKRTNTQTDAAEDIQHSSLRYDVG